MGLTALIGVIAVLIFAIVFVVPVLANIGDVAEKGLVCGALGICIEPTEDSEKFKEEVKKQEQEAEKVVPLTAGQTICDLQIKVKADLVDEFGFIKFKMDEADPSDYNWYCTFPASLVGKLSTFSIEPLAFFLESEFIHTEVKLIQKDDASRWYDANHPDYKSMYRELRITDTSGFVDLPLNFDQSFYIENVVYQDYILEIYQGRNINNLGAGQPIKDVVCEVGKYPC